MKITLEDSLPDGISHSFTREQAAAAPAHLRGLLTIEGVKSVFQVADFVAVERYPQADWRPVLAAVRYALEATEAATESVEPVGKVSVFIQVFRGLPMQIKLVTATEELRVGLPDRFAFRAKQAAALSVAFLAERTWEGRGIRYGDPADVGVEVGEELAAAYPEERLEAIFQRALAQGATPSSATVEKLSPAVLRERLQEKDWRRRYAALDQLDPTPEVLDLVVMAAHDENAATRRLAVVYLGQVELDVVVPHLIDALADPSAAVRRAAGDCLSDRGAVEAIAPMCHALQDVSKLVRWRAARFLYEVGDASALPSLRTAADSDPEFEVRLQAKMAIERIEEGRAAVTPAWRQLTDLLGPTDPT